MRWYPIGECKKKARIGRGLYKCNICGSAVKSGCVDHIKPIVPLNGFTTWDDYINSMFCEIDNLQFLCKDCHDKKTAEEKAIRLQRKKESR